MIILIFKLWMFFLYFNVLRYIVYGSVLKLVFVMIEFIFC